MSVASLDASSFDAAVASGVCALDFWAPWCGPCRMQGPIFESVADALSATPAKFFQVNVDEAPEIAGRFGVQSIPTLVVLKDGVETDVRVGVTPGPALKAMVEAALA